MFEHMSIKNVSMYVRMHASFWCNIQPMKENEEKRVPAPRPWHWQLDWLCHGHGHGHGHCHGVFILATSSRPTGLMLLTKNSFQWSVAFIRWLSQKFVFSVVRSLGALVMLLEHHSICSGCLWSRHYITGRDLVMASSDGSSSERC